MDDLPESSGLGGLDGVCVPPPPCPEQQLRRERKGKGASKQRHPTNGKPVHEPSASTPSRGEEDLSSRQREPKGMPPSIEGNAQLRGRKSRRSQITSEHQDVPETPEGENEKRSGDGTRFRQQFWKTEPCRFYKRGCLKGSSCPFAHGSDEMMVRPNLVKTSLCQAYAAGTCMLKSDECQFAHSPSELRATTLYKKTLVCKPFLRGNCQLGDQCRHAHSIAEVLSNWSGGASSRANNASTSSNTSQRPPRSSEASCRSRNDAERVVDNADVLCVGGRTKVQAGYPISDASSSRGGPPDSRVTQHTLPANGNTQNPAHECQMALMRNLQILQAQVAARSSDQADPVQRIMLQTEKLHGIIASQGWQAQTTPTSQVAMPSASQQVQNGSRSRMQKGTFSTTSNQAQPQSFMLPPNAHLGETQIHGSRELPTSLQRSSGSNQTRPQAFMLHPNAQRDNSQALPDRSLPASLPLSQIREPSSSGHHAMVHEGGFQETQEQFEENAGGSPNMSSTSQTSMPICTMLNEVPTAIVDYINNRAVEAYHAQDQVYED